MDPAAKHHLSHDRVLKNLITKFQIKEYRGGQSNYFLDLVEVITGQQLSMKVAAVIFKRFLALFEGHPTPEQVLAASSDQFRSIGLSAPKTNYVKNIAAAITSGSLIIDKISDLSDDEIKKELIKIKGVGPWSAEMFLMFSLKRPDIFSIGDLGLRTAIEKLYGINRDDKKQVLALAETWRPHRTLASRLLWASLE